MAHEINVVYQMNNKSAFFKVKNDAFSIGKILISFVQTDCSASQGSKVKRNIDIYVDIPKALALANDILSGKISALLEKSKTIKEENKDFQAVWQDMGGLDATKAANTKKECDRRTDGKALSRILRIKPGEKKPIIFEAMKGPGEVQGSGIIAPIYSQIEDRVIVAMTVDELKQFALMIQLHVNAYFSSNYSKYQNTYNGGSSNEH